MDYQKMWMEAKRKLMTLAAGKVKDENISSYGAKDVLNLLDMIEQQEYFGPDWEEKELAGEEVAE